MTAPAAELLLETRVMTTHESAKAAWRRERIDIFRRILAPVKRLSLSEWADQYRVLSMESNAEPGRWRTARVPYLREIMDAVSDPTVEEIVVMKGGQVGYTQGVILNAIGYFIMQDPGPILTVQPADGDAQEFSKEKLAPMLRDTPEVGRRVADAKSRDSDNTILWKTFPGGVLGITGATSPKGLRRRTVRYLLFDEVDGYPVSAGPEGDPIAITKNRAVTYGSRAKLVYGSTPLVKRKSRIEKLFAESDQRYYFVPCPHCQRKQRLEWGGRDAKHGIKWEAGKYETAHYVCIHCGERIEEKWKDWMLREGEWAVTNPESRTRGYHLSALYSPFEGASWWRLVKEWLEAQGNPQLLKAFINIKLAETYEEEGAKVEKSILVDRYESYPEGVRVPKGAAVLTRSVDVQDDRLETAVYAWGAGSECWPVEVEIIPGDPSLLETSVNSPWRILAQEHLTRSYKHESGVELRPAVTFVDTGGHNTQEAYAFCRPRRAQRLYAIKGSNIEGAPLLSKPSEHSAARLILYHVGSSTGKSALAHRLIKVREPGPGYIHIPDFLDDEHLNQLTAEQAVTRNVNGREITRWVKTYARNEQTDMWVYAYAALWQPGPKFVRDLHLMVERINQLGDSGRTIPPQAPSGRRMISRGIE